MSEGILEFMMDAVLGFDTLMEWIRGWNGYDELNTMN